MVRVERAGRLARLRGAEADATERERDLALLFAFEELFLFVARVSDVLQ